MNDTEELSSVEILKVVRYCEAMLGVINVSFIDYDIVSNSNRNRMPCFTFFDCIGHRKVDVLKVILGKMNPNANFESIYGKIVESENDLTEKDRKNDIKAISPDVLASYDLVMSCGDNPDVRLVLNRYISQVYKDQKKAISIIDGGTGPKKGNTAVYIPGVNACIDNQLGISLHPRVQAHCNADNQAPSVVYTNMIIASLMCGEALLALNSNGLHKPIRNPMTYNGINFYRFGLQQYESDRCELCK